MDSFFRRPKSMETAAQSGTRERRRCVRYEFDARITINSHDREGGTAIWGRCSDLSEEGLGATIVGSLNLGEVLSIQLPLRPHEQPVSLQATVRYQNGFHYGFEFLTMNDATREALRSTCAGLAQGIL